MQNTKDSRSSLNTTSLNVDLKFLINCCKINPIEEDFKAICSYLNTERLELITLISLANQHGILPLVYKTLKKLPTNAPPGNTLGVHKLQITNYESLSNFLIDLKSEYSQIARRNMLMSAELIKIMKLLKENHIEPLAFKGPALAQMAYGDITLRQYVDLDILVDENHIFSAGELITSSSYIPDSDINFLKNDKLLDVSSDLGFRNSRNNIYIELHWKLFRKKFSKTMNELNIRSNSTIIEIQGKKIKTLQPDLLLVYLCSHGSKHMWERIEWITDIDRLICNVESINWEMVWGYAQKMHSINTLLLGLSLSQELFGTNLPAFIEEKLNSHGNIQSLKTDTLELLHHNASSQAQSSGITAMFKKFGYHSKLHDSFWDKAKFYFTIFFKVTPDDVLNINLPKQLYFLYYIIRPFRLIYSRLNYTDK